MKDTGENRLFPPILVFGLVPRFHILITNLPNQRNRMEILKIAQAEMTSIKEGRRVLATLTRIILPTAGRHCKLGKEVFIFSEN